MIDIDQEKTDRFNKQTVRIMKKMEDVLRTEMDNRESVEFCIHAAVYSPLTFAMNVFRIANEAGFNSSKQFPTFIDVYKNYLKTLSDLDNDWRTLPFEEFEKKFIEKYKKLGHLVLESDD